MGTASRGEVFEAAQDYGVNAAPYDPALSAGGGFTLATTVLSLIRLRAFKQFTLASAVLQVHTAGATLTAGQNLIGVYDDTGLLIATSADQAGVWTSTGYKTAAMSAVSLANLTIQADRYYFVGLLSNGTTPVTVTRGVNLALANGSLTAPFRFGTFSTALTALPTSIALASVTANANSPWAGLV